MAIRWVSAIFMSWAPILTYSRKRDEVLEWVEANLDPLAFSDGEKSLGLAFEQPDMRLSFSRRSMILSSGASGESMEASLDEPLRGILDILRPAQTKVGRIVLRASAGLEVEDYATTAADFARRAHGGVASLARWDTTDAAVLSDLETEEFRALVDYGIVSPQEIEERVLDPDLSRIGELLDRPAPSGMSERLSEVPPVSLFADALLTPRTKEYVTSSDDIWRSYSSAEEQLLELTAALANTITNQGEGHE